MILTEPKLISPLLDDFMIGEAMSDHNGVRCYPAMKKESDVRYIVKVISIPASEAQLNALLLSGAFSGKSSASEYFAQLAEDVKKETEVLEELSKLEGFLPIEGCQVVQKDDSSGYDIYLLYRYRRSLERHCRKTCMTHLAAVNLALDMCASLAVCRQMGYMYVDLKPSNIYVSDDNEYRIGDIGFVDMNNLMYASLPDRCHSPYIPPELHDPFAAIDKTADTYAAGMVLYQIYNGGVLPFEGQVPDGPLQPPLYADYEMCEIIMKACSSDPAQRWDDPVKMGQAIVSYMQRNTVNDTPILPLPVVSDITVTEQTQEEAQQSVGQTIVTDTEISLEENQALSEDDPANLAFMSSLVSDETAPQEEFASEIQYSEVSDDANDILSIADDLIAHEPPAPPVAPDAVEVPIPEPIVLQTESNEEISGTPVTEADEGNASDTVVDDTVAAISQAVASSQGSLDAEFDTDLLFGDNEQNIEPPSQEFENMPQESAEQKSNKSPWIFRILTAALLVILTTCIALGIYLFYRDYYMKTIDKMVIEGVDNRMTVYVTTKADPSLLTVVCTDSYGTRQTAPLENGMAKFGNLSADSLYHISIEIDGFHGLRGQIKGTHTTPPQTEIVSLNPVVGSEAGSVMLSFTVKGYDSEKWVLTYSADNEPERSVTFTGHNTTVSGLTVGKTYTFTLDSVSDVYIVGQNSIQFGASDLIYPENLAVTGIGEDGLHVKWETPANTAVDHWTVLCYNDAGFSQNMTTKENAATFENLDPTDSYTVEVTASGMSVGSRFYVSKNAVTIGTINAVPSGYYMDVTWDYTGPDPVSDWRLIYSIDEDSTEYVASAEGTTAKIENLVPNSQYTLKLQLADGTTVLNDTTVVSIPEAAPFANYTVSAADMKLTMCLVPEVADWTHKNVTTYKDSYVIGEKAGFVMRLYRTYMTSPDNIATLFVIRNSEGKIVKIGSTSQSWTSMWFQSYGELTIPEMPTEAGEYTIEIYFNSAFVHKQNFSITEPETSPAP